MRQYPPWVAVSQCFCPCVYNLLQFPFRLVYVLWIRTPVSLLNLRQVKPPIISQPNIPQIHSLSRPSRGSTSSIFHSRSKTSKICGVWDRIVCVFSPLHGERHRGKKHHGNPLSVLFSALSEERCSVQSGALDARYPAGQNETGTNLIWKSSEDVSRLSRHPAGSEAVDLSRCTIGASTAPARAVL